MNFSKMCEYAPVSTIEMFCERRGLPRGLLDGQSKITTTALDRPILRVDPVERAILRAGAYELLYCPQVPARAIINEAVDLAKLLGADQGHRYVNGVLDRLAKELRPDELAGRAVAGRGASTS